MDVGLYAVAIGNLQPVEVSTDVQFYILADVEHPKNFVWTTSKNIPFSLVSIFQYYHPPSLSPLRQSHVLVHLQDHMHLASTFLSEPGAHRIEGAFSSMHVIT